MRPNPRLFLSLLVGFCLLAGCGPTAPPIKDPPHPSLTPRPPRPTQPSGPRPTRQPLPTQTQPPEQPSPTTQPTPTEQAAAPFPLGRKFEGIFARNLLCKNGRLWLTGPEGLTMLDPESMTRSDFPVENMIGGPWAVDDWIWTYEYLADDAHTGGYLVGRDPRSGQIEKYLDMMQNLEWETFLLGMGRVGSEYWIGLDAPQALLIDRMNGKAVGSAELPGIARLILDTGLDIWFAGDELFVMNKETQQFTSVLEEYVSGLDTDLWNVWVMTLEGTLHKFDLSTQTWEEYLLSPDAWAGCLDGKSYWYADAYLEVVQEIILP